MSEPASGAGSGLSSGLDSGEDGGGSGATVGAGTSGVASGGGGMGGGAMGGGSGGAIAFFPLGNAGLPVTGFATGFKTGTGALAGRFGTFFFKNASTTARFFVPPMVTDF